MRPAPRLGLLLVVVSLAGFPAVMAHTPVVDADLSDWCIGAFSNTAPGGGRVEDSSAMLTCGNCSVTTDQACVVNSDCSTANCDGCAAGETCVNLNSKEETIWWDNRTDGAVNDLGTFATTQDANNIYFAAELWVDPDPVSLPFAEVAIDFEPGGINTWLDPQGKMVAPGNCSVSTDRACTTDEDCHFCMISTEPFPSTRVRTCGSACDPDIGDSCDMTQTCLNIGTTPIANAGLDSNPSSIPDLLLVFDFSRWLIGLDDATRIYFNNGGTWTGGPVFLPAVNPGASGGSGGPPGSVEIAIPWTAFQQVGANFGPGDDFRYTVVVARGASNLDYLPDGAIEDVFSEQVAGTTTTSQDNCMGMGIGTTNCEIADGSLDAFIPGPPAAPGGRTDDLQVAKAGGSDIQLSWNASCSALDTDYSVYEGTIGTFYDHVPVPALCSTGGATSATFTPGADSQYYLIVPNDAANEGSYGVDSGSSERPVSTSACNTQLLGNCP